MCEDDGSSDSSKDQRHCKRKQNHVVVREDDGVWASQPAGDGSSQGHDGEELCERGGKVSRALFAFVPPNIKQADGEMANDNAEERAEHPKVLEGELCAENDRRKGNHLCDGDLPDF